jgi:alpha-galactosidase
MGVAHIIDLLGRPSSFAGPRHWNEPDMLRSQTAAHRRRGRSHFSFWSLLAAPLLAGNDLRSMRTNPAAVLLNREVIAIDQYRLGHAGRARADSGAYDGLVMVLADGARAVHASSNRGSEAGRSRPSW